MKRLLIVEDDQSLREMFPLAFAGLGIHIKTASSVEEAILVLGSFSPDTLLLDLILDGMYCGDIIPYAPNAKKVVVMTASSKTPDFIRGICGPVTILYKPFPLHELYKALALT